MNNVKRYLACFIILALIFSGFGIKQTKNSLKSAKTTQKKIYKSVSPKAKKSTIKEIPNLAIKPPAITRRPSIVHMIYDNNLKALPTYNPYDLTGGEIDVRSRDLSSFDLTDRIKDLLYATFDSQTKWPQKLPKDFDPNIVLEKNKNPGLNIHKLSSEGITGKGVNIAIIDNALLVDHKEYGDRVKMYEEIHCLDEVSQMHGLATASIALGKTTGVAPEANLYFIGCSNFDSDGAGHLIGNYKYTTKAVDRIIEVNRYLPKDQKIRVLSISACWSPDMTGYKEMSQAVKRAVKEGIFVISCNLFETYDNNYNFYGLDSDEVSDKDNFSSYNVMPWPNWMSLVANRGKFSQYYQKKFSEKEPDQMLLVPISSKTLASPTGYSDYAFYRDGGWSWAIPYLAGVYALSCQVKPDITPDIFWKAALTTGEGRAIVKGDKKYAGKIINPEKLIEYIKSMN